MKFLSELIDSYSESDVKFNHFSQTWSSSL